MGLLIMVPMLPGLLSSVYPIANRPWMAPVPMLGQHLLMSDLLGGKPVAAASVALAGLVTAAAAGGLVRLATGLRARADCLRPVRR